mmetsp:Transcript_12941/g.39830  ORF Transcript_12941/g.39830 Transcript_12941/m.39830 type:complete len:337 (-) Transcript_12941:1176-2186(-)
MDVAFTVTARPGGGTRRWRPATSGRHRSRSGGFAVVCVFLPPEGVPEVPDDDEDEEKEVEEMRRAARGANLSSRNAFAGAEQLNELFTPTYTERLRLVLKPDEAFGVIFTWGSVMGNARDLELESWRRVAEEEKLLPPTMQDIVRAEAFVPESAVQRVFFWTNDWGRIKRLVFRKVEIYNDLFDKYDFELRSGCREWLEGLAKYGMRSCLCASLPRERVDLILKKLKLERLFAEFVTIEDEPEDFQRTVLLACERVERPPQKTVVFCESPAEVIASHEMQAKAVALIGAYKSYELRPADSNVRNFHDLGVYNVRRLFSQDQGYEPEMQLEEELQRE